MAAKNGNSISVIINKRHGNNGSQRSCIPSFSHTSPSHDIYSVGIIILCWFTHAFIVGTVSCFRLQAFFLSACRLPFCLG